MKGASTRLRGPRLDNHGIDIRGDGIIVESDGVLLHTRRACVEEESVLPNGPAALLRVHETGIITHTCVSTAKKKGFVCRKNSQREWARFGPSEISSFVASRYDENVDWTITE